MGETWRSKAKLPCPSFRSLSPSIFSSVQFLFFVGLSGPIVISFLLGSWITARLGCRGSRRLPLQRQSLFQLGDGAGPRL